MKHNLLLNRISTIKYCTELNNCRKWYSTQEKKYPRRIFSGIQPSGTIHLGNYLGAIKQWINLQDSIDTKTNMLCSIVDMHAITLSQNPKELQNNILEMVATFLACGLNPDKSILFQQSSVPMHAELSWVLGCMTTVPKLSQLPQFKEKSEKLKIIPLGLLTYPILQASDILLYKATDVPIGEDQLQHLHLTQHIVHCFNGKYGSTFPIPQPLMNSFSGRIKSLREPSKKMSKSSQYKKSCIRLTDSPETIKEFMQKAVTDFISEVSFEPENRPGVSNLINIHSLLTDKPPDVICQEATGLNTGQYKLIVAAVIIEKFTPIREEFFKLMDNPGYLLSVLNNGSLEALSLAEKCWSEVKQKVGFTGGILSVENRHKLHKQL